jgi:diguanylate cyclase (GGDEF)-like protein
MDMFREDYDAMILNRIEKSFDSIMPIGSVIAWLSAIMVYFSAISNRFVVYNSIVGIIFLIVSLIKKKVSIELKIVITISVPIIMGVLSFLDGGFGSAGLSLLMISNIMAVLLLSKENSRAVGFFSLVIFIGLFIFYRYNGLKVSIHADSSLWAIQFLVFFLYIFILHTVVYSIRGYLLENIKSLENSIIRIEELAYYDQLTGLINEYKFKEELEKVKDKNHEGFLVMFNVNNLGVINSIYGDSMGDDVLYNIAKNFDGERKPEELLSRISGNEFSIWIPCDGEEYFYERVDDYQENFKNNFNIPKLSNKIQFKASYVRHEKSHNIDETYRKARLALTHAKVREGVEKVYYDNELDMMFRHEYRLKETVEKYLDNSSFTIHYQPKISCYTGRISGVEALARINDDHLGQISPIEFVNMIEKMNQSVDFGKIIISKVLNDYYKIIDKYGKDTSVSINISPSHFISEGFSEFLLESTKKYNVPNEKIIIELTEEVAINNFDKVIQVMSELRAKGIRISLDDFGSGYSSLNYLSKLIIDEVKIDKAFVSQIGNNDRIDIMIKTIVNLSKQYGLSVVAEGVETSDQYDKLNEIGCDEIQGYYFFKPESL